MRSGSIARRETALYEDVWSSIDVYGEHSPGERLLPVFLDMAGLRDRGGAGATVLDAGCGSGKGALALQACRFDVQLCDLTAGGLCAAAEALPFAEACLWQDLRSQLRMRGDAFDYVYCCDVLEHVAPEFTMLTIVQLLRVASRGVFLNISLMHDDFGVHVGQPLHVSVFPFHWWRDRIRELGDLVEARDLLSSGCYFVRPR